MILFSEIYKKAFILFDDPKITQAFNTDKIAFGKYMYGYLSTVSIFEPIVISQELTDINLPEGKLELIDGDDENNSFELDFVIPDNAYVKYTENGTIVDADYDKATNVVTFPHVLSNDGEYGVEYYFPGSYNTDFSSIISDPKSKANIIKRVTDILARLIVIAWAESTRDMLVDIQGLLRDSDFKITPNNQILNAKVKWVEALQEKNNQDQNKLSWMLRYSSNGPAKYKR